MGIMELVQKCNYSLHDFLKLVKKLRASNSFGWDKLNKHTSIRVSLIEEAYDVLEAIDIDDDEMLKEKLGDLLLQIAFHCDIEEENKNFSFEDVVDKICKKIISKYPHVFREESSRNESSSRCRVYNLREREPKGLELRRNRMNNHSAEEEVKRVSRILPALMRSAKVQERAAKAGYGLFSMEDALNETFERLHYLENLILDGRQDHYYKEIGDLLFSMTEISRLVGIDAESALYDSCERFKNEFLYKLSLEKGEKL